MLISHLGILSNIPQVRQLVENDRLSHILCGIITAAPSRLLYILPPV